MSTTPPTSFTFVHGVGAGFYADLINYSIHDNGGSPYRVQVDHDKETATVWMQLSPPTEDGEDSEEYNKETDDLYLSDDSSSPFLLNKNYIQREKYLTTFQFSNIWIGVDSVHPQWSGNTILLRTAPTTSGSGGSSGTRGQMYILIGNRGILIVDIPDDEEIYILFSPVGENDVPSEYAVGKNRIYLFEESVSLPTSQVPLSLILSTGGSSDDYRDIYDEYYRNDTRETCNEPSSSSSSKEKKKHNCKFDKMKPSIQLVDRDCPWTGSCKLKN
jgi:hypothetical protein